MLVHTTSYDASLSDRLLLGRMEQETELARLDFWPPEALKRLSGSWITTAEQLVAIAATSGGMSSLAQQTGLTLRELTRLVDRTRQMLPLSIRAQLSKPADTSQFGTGASEPSKKREQ